MFPREQNSDLGFFALMVNDLRTSRVNNGIKFVDDLTISESVPKFALSQIQDSVTEIQDSSGSNHFRLYQKKCKELRIDFKIHQTIFPPIQVNGKPIEVVEEAKLLGLTIPSNLKWNKHMLIMLSLKAPNRYIYLFRTIETG